MAGEKKQVFRDLGFEDLIQAHWAGSKKDEDFGSMEMEPSSFTSSSCVSTSADLADDASSSSSNSLDSSSSTGPLFELSDLMAQLPIKRGLSKFYHGKSQTFGSLANVRSLEDLAKETCYSQRMMKSCKSYRGDLNQRKFGPKPTIRKRPPVNRSFSPHLSTNKGVILVD